MLFLPALWYTTFLRDEGAQRWEEVYETEEALVLLQPASQARWGGLRCSHARALQ